MTTEAPARLPVLGLNGIKLLSGGHSSREEGVCSMEAVAWLAGEAHSDKPACTCSALAAYVRKLNDRWNDEERQRLKDFLPRLIGTNGGYALARKRGQFFARAACIEVLPLALERAKLPELATELRGMKDASWEDLRGAARKARAELQKRYAADAYADAAAYAAAAYAADAAAYAADAAAAAAAADAYADAADAADAAAYAADAAYADAAAARKPVIEIALDMLSRAISIVE